jgi:hypothetical protein
MKRVTILLMMSMFLTGLLFSPTAAKAQSGAGQEIPLNTNLGIQHETASVLPGPVRVALYNSTNTVEPAYVSGQVRTNYSAVYDLLVNAGFDVTRITSSDIANYELQPSAYDVLVLADNVPLANETDIVKDFWLGGGGILGLDTAASYFCYEGILPREAEGTSGNPEYFNYIYNDVDNVTARHPVTQSYQIDDSLSKDYVDLAAYNWTALQESSIADDLTRLTADDDNDEWAFAVASDASDRGGRVVHIGITIGNLYPTDFDDMVVDAVEWMCPQPKGRVAFDYSHEPYYGVDNWDDYCTLSGRYEELRDDIVSRGLTFDKLMPSSEGNLTEGRLEPFDVLITVLPDLNYTSAEVNAVESWVSEGGGFYALSDRWASGLVDNGQNLNYLLSSFDVSIYETGDGSSVTVSDHSNHPTTEGCASISVTVPGFMNVTGDAEAVWWQGGNTYAGADTHDEGRVMLVSDSNFAGDAYIDDNSNRAFTFNVVNWLSSDDAEVLVFTNEPTAESVFSGKSIHGLETPVAEAMNELGVSYMLHESMSYFNRSLRARSWNLVVIDAPWGLSSGSLDDLEWYVDNGGRFLMNYYHITANPSHSLWGKLGFNYTGDLSDPTPVYTWNSNHPIFEIPLEYGASNYSGPRDYGSTGDLLHVFDNATALAGITESPEDGNATLVLRNDGKTLYDSYLTDQYSGDTDDSTYEDRFELWINELAFMLRPEIDSPSDVALQLGDTGESVVWQPSSYKPANYVIKDNGTNIESGTWDGGTVSLSLDDFGLGTHIVTCTAIDAYGEKEMDKVIVTVEDTTAPVLDSPADIEYTEGETGNTIEWTVTDPQSGTWELLLNGTSDNTGTWSSGGDAISIDVNNLASGTYNFTMIVEDGSGNTASDSVIVTVVEPSAGGPFGLPETVFGIDTWILLVAAGIIVLLLIVVIAKR